MDLFVKCHLKLHIDITLHYVEVAAVAAVGGSGAGWTGVEAKQRQRDSIIRLFTPR